MQQACWQVDILCCDVDCLDATNMAFTFGCQDADNMQHQPQLLRFARLAAAAQQIIALVDDPGKVSCTVAPAAVHVWLMLTSSASY